MRPRRYVDSYSLRPPAYRTATDKEDDKYLGRRQKALWGRFSGDPPGVAL